ncbi:MAG: hypothetical protein ACI4MI_00640 [Christensenellales bacterium]
MTKKIVVAALVAVMLVSCLFIFAGCVNGTYVNGDSYVKLGAMGKAEVKISIFGFSRTDEFKYTSKKNDDGVVYIYEVTEKDGEKNETAFAYINDDGNLVVLGVATFTKK